MHTQRTARGPRIYIPRQPGLRSSLSVMNTNPVTNTSLHKIRVKTACQTTNCSASGGCALRAPFSGDFPPSRPPNVLLVDCQVFRHPDYWTLPVDLRIFRMRPFVRITVTDCSSAFQRNSWMDFRPSSSQKLG